MFVLCKDAICIYVCMCVYKLWTEYTSLHCDTIKKVLLFWRNQIVSLTRQLKSNCNLANLTYIMLVFYPQISQLSQHCDYGMHVK